MYQLKILTPEEVFFEGEVISTVVPGKSGYLGILTDHTPLVSSLKPGILMFTDVNETKHFFEVESGFLEVNQNQVAVLVEGIRATAPVDMLSGLN